MIAGEPSRLDRHDLLTVAAVVAAFDQLGAITTARPHQARHAYASQLLAAGVAAPVVVEALHRSRRQRLVTGGAA